MAPEILLEDLRGGLQMIDIEVNSPITANAEVQTYVLVSDDIYVRRYDSSTVPDWYRSLVESIVTTDPTITDIQGAIDFLTLQGTGFSQSIVNLETADSSINSSLTTLLSQVGANTAGIGSLQVAKVDSTQATAIATDVVASSFGVGGMANAWFTSQISTYASEIAANASSISTLSATLDGHTVSIDTIEQIAIEANTWSANASKLITSPDGSITGWSFGDGSNIQSYFKINATNFSISDGITGYTPFSISGSNILFNGVVDFTSTNTYGTTTIDGDKITTGTIDASKINVLNLSALSADLGTVTAGIVYDSSWDGITYKMKIDLNNGFIHIK